MNKQTISGPGFLADCKCVWYKKLFCNCRYTNTKVEKFCNKNPSPVSLESRAPIVQSLDRTEAALYRKRSEGPGRYAYSQPMVPICNPSEATGYIVGRNGMLPLADKEVDIESSLRYTERLDVKGFSRPLCVNGPVESRYTREIRPLNDITSVSYDRWENLLCDPQRNIAGHSYQFGSNTKNEHHDIYFKNFKK